MIKKILFIIFFLSLSSCSSVSPGMHMKTKNDWNEGEYVYVNSIDQNILIEDISKLERNLNKNTLYRIGNGDQIAVTVWGLNDVFPTTNVNPDLNFRRVDSNGNIYFPYIGLMKALNKTQNELREDLTKELSKFFTDPQLDVKVGKFNSQKVYLLGEITTPIRIDITDVPLSLAQALGEAKGLRTETSSGSEVFIIRQSESLNGPRIFKANLSSPAGFLSAGNFYLIDNDIVYVNAKNTTRWNRVIAQFFPFSTFLNSIDNLTED